MGCCISKVEPTPEIPATRGCTDVLWLCIYVLFWALMIFIAAFSLVYGSPLRLLNGYDSFGNTCGKNNYPIGNMALSGLNMEDKTKLFFMDVKDIQKTLKICVKKCPNRNLNSLEDFKAFYIETGSNLCRYDFDFNELDKPEIKNQPARKESLSSSMGPCPAAPVYDSVPVLNRCVPRPAKELAQQVFSKFYAVLNSWDTLEQILSDLYHSWKEMLALSFLAFIVALITVSILHLLASLVSMIIMVFVTISCIGGTGFLWYTYYELKTKLDDTPDSMILMESTRNETAFLWYSIIATIITIILMILMSLMCRQVDLLAELFRETGRCLAAVPGLFLQPLITFVVLLGFYAFWVAIILCLATANYMDVSPLKPYSDKHSVAATEKPLTDSSLSPLNISVSDIKTYTLVQYVNPTWVKYMWWVYFIGLIWTSEFIMACQSMVIAGAVAHWFYRNRYKTSDHVTYSICKLLKYHLGSVAKGSFLITIFKIPRLIMMYLHSKLKDNETKGSEVAKCCLKGCICCFYCLEKFIRYLNHNAYTVIAIDGSNFCTAAGTAFEVLTSHPLQVATINSLGDFILFLGKCLVTAVTGTVGLFFFKRNTKLTFYAAPTLLTCVFAFFIAHCILSLYEMVLDTLYLCRCQNGDNIEVESKKTEELQQEPQQQTELEPMNNE